MSLSIEEDKMIFKREVFQSVMKYTAYGLIPYIILNFIFLYIISVEELISENNLFFAGIITFIVAFSVYIYWGFLSYFALKNNWKKFGFKEYKYKATYVSYILFFIILFQVLFNYILYNKFSIPDIALLIIINLAIPYFVKTPIDKISGTGNTYVEGENFSADIKFASEKYKWVEFTKKFGISFILVYLIIIILSYFFIDNKILFGVIIGFMPSILISFITTFFLMKKKNKNS